MSLSGTNAVISRLLAQQAIAGSSQLSSQSMPREAFASPGAQPAAAAPRSPASPDSESRFASWRAAHTAASLILLPAADILDFCTTPRHVELVADTLAIPAASRCAVKDLPKRLHRYLTAATASAILASTRQPAAAKPAARKRASFKSPAPAAKRSLKAPAAETSSVESAPQPSSDESSASRAARLEARAARRAESPPPAEPLALESPQAE